MNERIGVIVGLVLVALLLIGCSRPPAATAAELADSYRLTMLETWANAEAHEWEIRARTAGSGESLESMLLYWANLEAQEWQTRARQEAAGPRVDAETFLYWANLEAREWQSRTREPAVAGTP
jgi:hypothetical protein